MGRWLLRASCLLLITVVRTHACGPDFPNYILDDGMNDLLLAPVADFARELERLQFRPPVFRAVQTTNENFATESTDAELRDLRHALRKASVPGEEANDLVAKHRETRSRLEAYVTERQNFEHRPRWQWREGRSVDTSGEIAPVMPEMEVTPGLPPEFASYLQGAIIWHNPALTNKAEARTAWERVLALPPGERKYKSTWAAYMLGRSWAAEEPEKARKYFQKVRELAHQGFSDSLGLAAASIGWEAKTYYDHTNYARATELYLEQYATGDSSAVHSLLFAIERALSQGGDADLSALATNEPSRRAVTAYLISRGNFFYNAEYSNSDVGENPASVWLKAVEHAGVSDVTSAEALALAAYRAGDFDTAQRWIERAKASPTAQWLQAKLFLRAGKLDQAAALLAHVSRSFPVEISLTNAPATLAETLFAPRRTQNEERNGTAAGREVLAEVGALKLARREFVTSLDALLNAGFWMDAAYVAERVLTTDELKRYVDEKWPATVPAESGSETATGLLAGMSNHLRYLLGRRLTREKRGHEARDYFPAEWRPKFDELITALQNGADQTLSPADRGRQLFIAAIIARTNGLELFGTEVAPDWRIYNGDFEGSVTIATRTNASFGDLAASESERRRAFEAAPDPDERFHYRWQAAYLGWAAAQLLPDNSEETALVLCRAGSWLKQRDPTVADVFYKSLVNRCRKTPLGQEADRIRWFPRLDEEGRWIPRTQAPRMNEPASAPEVERPRSSEPTPTLESLTPGTAYREHIVHAGESLLSITQRYRSAGERMTLHEILEANPEVKQASRQQLVIGQRLRIPVVPHRAP